MNHSGKQGYQVEWLDILKEIAIIQNQNEFIWFRGVSKSWYKLDSGLVAENNNIDRKLCKKNNGLPSNNENKKFHLNENTNYNLFDRIGHTYHKLKDWDLLYTMQHHGAKTRLLDWTESLATALYFATKNWSDEDDEEEGGSLWILKPLKLNKLNMGDYTFFNTNKISYEEYLGRKWESEKVKIGNDKDFQFRKTFAIFPSRNSRRMVAQQGAFTFQGLDDLPLDQEIAQEVKAKKKNGELDKFYRNDQIIKEIKLPRSVMKDIRLFLKQSGVTDYSLFPSLDGLSEYINKEGRKYVDNIDH